MSCKIEAVKALAQEIKADGFRVFISKSGTHGFYTDAAGTKVVSFQFDLGGLFT
jgi:Fe-S cluster assembly iron-binding protein IscA